jgi:predicted transcriptional regulator
MSAARAITATWARSKRRPTLFRHLHSFSRIFGLTWTTGVHHESRNFGRRVAPSHQQAVFGSARRQRAHGSYITFESPELLFQTLTQMRWNIIKAITGAGPLSIREIARHVARDVKAVHRECELQRGHGWYRLQGYDHSSADCCQCVQRAEQRQDRVRRKSACSESVIF